VTNNLPVLTVTTGGTGYTSQPTITLVNKAAGAGATFTATITTATADTTANLARAVAQAGNIKTAVVAAGSTANGLSTALAATNVAVVVAAAAAPAYKATVTITSTATAIAEFTALMATQAFETVIKAALGLTDGFVIHDTTPAWTFPPTSTYAVTFDITGADGATAALKTVTEAAFVAAGSGLVPPLTAKEVVFTAGTYASKYPATVTITSSPDRSVKIAHALIAAQAKALGGTYATGYAIASATAVFPYVFTLKLVGATDTQDLAAAQGNITPIKAAVVAAGKATSGLATDLTTGEVGVVVTATSTAKQYLATVTIKSTAANMPKLTALLLTSAGQTEVLKITYATSFTLLANSAVFYAPPAAAPAATATAPSGTVKYAVKLSFSGSAPTGDALTTFKASVADKMAATLFGGKIGAADIVVTVSEGRRRLLAFTATGTTTSNQATIDALKAAYGTNVAAFEAAVKADATLKGYGLTGVSANTGSSFIASSIAAAACLIVLA